MSFSPKELAGHKLALVTLIATAIAILFAGFCPLLTTDTCCRSAPMAEAFAVGDWTRAFHPRFGLGPPVVAGTIRFLTGLDGYTACSVGSAVAWALTIIPLFFLARKVFDETTAWFAVVLYLIAPMHFLWCLMGLRETYKTLGIVMMVDAVFRCREGGWRNYLEALFGLLFLLYFKVDAIVYGALLSVAYMFADRFRRRGWCLLLALVIFLQPCCALVHDWTGVWLPAPQYADVFAKLTGGWR